MERAFTVSTSQDDAYLSVSFDGEVASWMRVVGLAEKVSGGHPAEVRIALDVPANVAPGSYSGSVIVKARPQVKREGDYSPTIVTVVKSQVNIEVSSDYVTECVLGGVRVYDVEEGSPVSVALSIANTGTTRLIPHVRFSVWNQNVSEILASSEKAGDWLLPGNSQSFVLSSEEGLLTGGYWLELESSLCNVTLFEEFRVQERGSVIDRGQLRRIEIPKTSQVGTVVPLKIRFENQGGRPEAVKFVGEVFRDGRLVDRIETDITHVAVEEAIDLESFYTPALAGEYRLSGRVVYNNRVSSEKEVLFSVVDDAREAELAAGSPSFLVVIFILVLIMLLLLLLIWQKRRKR